MGAGGWLQVEALMEPPPPGTLLGLGKPKKRAEAEGKAEHECQKTCEGASTNIPLMLKSALAIATHALGAPFWRASFPANCSWIVAAVLLLTPQSPSIPRHTAHKVHQFHVYVVVVCSKWCSQDVSARQASVSLGASHC